MKTATKFGHTRTAVVGLEHIAQASRQLQALDFGQRERLADEIHGAQPNLFYSVLVLHRYGSSAEQIEIVLNLLFVVYLVMKATGRARPLITEAHSRTMFDAPDRPHSIRRGVDPRTAICNRVVRHAGSS